MSSCLKGKAIKVRFVKDFPSLLHGGTSFVPPIYFYIGKLAKKWNDLAKFQCSWQASNTRIGASNASSWQCFHLSFKQIFKSASLTWLENTENTRLSAEISAHEYHQVHPQDFRHSASFDFVLDCLSAAHRTSHSVATLIVPRSGGYIARSDIVPLRLMDCPPVTSVASFATPGQFFDGNAIGIQHLLELPKLFAASVGGMLLKSNDLTQISSIESLSGSLEHELHNRLSFPWLSMEEPKRRALAIVEGGRTGPDHGGVGESIYSSARALGIDMVVFDNPGHWIQDSRYTDWYKAFVPLKLELHPDAQFASHIIDAVSSYKGPIDGIVTFRDHYKSYVAEAALQLGLPTDAPSAYAIATDKFKTSISEGHHAYRASSIGQASGIVQDHKLEFPLIIKPTNGFLSEGVFRVESLLQLQIGIQGINTERHGTEFVIEKYCEGPEIDANLVLCDGKLIFFEASDDFPKSADTNGHGNVKTFIELANVLPSKLPEYEQAMLRESLTQSLIRMGFTNGYFHLEARVENSSMEYATNNGVLDLTQRSIPAKDAPSSWLIEVNPRPPGIQESEASKHTYGVDCWGLGLLFALNDNHRVKLLSHPFSQGPQYWCEMVFIPVLNGGVYESGDVCTELLARRPDLAAHVMGCFCFLKKGDTVPHPGTGVNAWVAYFNVFSRESREHVLKIGEAVRRECRVLIV